MTEQQEREAFEAWFQKAYGRPVADKGGNLNDLGRWMTWQARASLAAAQVEPTPHPPYCSGGCCNPEDREVLTDEVIANLADDFKSQYQHGGTTFDEFDYMGFGRAIAALSTPAPNSAEAWISVNDKLPPAATRVLVYGRKWGDKLSTAHVFETFISTRPRECVEDEEITHWMPLPAPPAAIESIERRAE